MYRDQPGIHEKVLETDQFYKHRSKQKVEDFISNLEQRLKNQVDNKNKKDQGLREKLIKEGRLTDDKAQEEFVLKLKHIHSKSHLDDTLSVRQMEEIKKAQAKYIEDKKADTKMRQL